MDKRMIERARIKAFYRMLVERLGEANWATRRASLISRIRACESNIDLKKPIEAQLFKPPSDDIDWYILIAELAFDVPYSDSHYSSTRIYPYAMAIGAFAEQLKKVPNVEQIIDRMLANKSKPETQIFELLTAMFYLKNGYDVSFISENSIDWSDGVTKKTPDLLVKNNDVELYVECKRADKHTQYSQSEENAWERIWNQLHPYLLKALPWSVVYLTFHSQITEVSADDLIKLVEMAINSKSRKITGAPVSVEIRAINKRKLKNHYLHNAVRPNSSQQELLVFGDLNSNEKRSVATIADGIVLPGEPDAILNIFIEDVANCIGAQWQCDHEISLERRSRHFKGLVHTATSQIPPDKKGIVHIFYETVEGIDVEEMRSKKHLDNLLTYDASGTSVLGVLIHSVNYYPSEGDYQWAETVQSFARISNLSDLFRHSLMLSGDATPEITGTTHWEQDRNGAPVSGIL